MDVDGSGWIGMQVEWQTVWPVWITGLEPWNHLAREMADGRRETRRERGAEREREKVRY
jgi:hypothetical protein